MCLRRKKRRQGSRQQTLSPCRPSGQRHDPKRPSGSWRGRWEERHEQAEDPGRQLLARPDCRMRLKSWGRRRTPRSPSIMNHGNGLGAAAWPSAVESWEAGTR